MKRFYKTVATQKTDNGFLVVLDARPVKTAMRADLCAPNENLANALMREWAEQDGDIIPDTMPLTQILSTKIDRVSNEREAMQSYMFKYLDTDLLCYRTDGPPPELGETQNKTWDPYLEWFAKHFGVTLQTTTALKALSQDPKAHEIVQKTITELDDDRFTAFQLITSLCGSLVLGLAALNKQINADEIFGAMRVEENFKAEIYNEEFYGADPAQESKDKSIKEDLHAAIHYLELLD